MDLTDLILKVLRRQGSSGRRPATRALMADAQLGEDVERLIEELYPALDVDFELDLRTVRLAFREACQALRIEALDRDLLERGMVPRGIFGDDSAPLRTGGIFKNAPIDLGPAIPAAAPMDAIAQLLEMHRELLRVHAELLARLGPRPEAPPEHK
jgi:hypothetical protein